MDRFGIALDGFYPEHTRSLLVSDGFQSALNEAWWPVAIGTPVWSAVASSAAAWTTDSPDSATWTDIVPLTPLGNERIGE